jgi:hypothetical protein
MYSMITDSLNQLLLTHCTEQSIRSLEQVLQNDHYGERRQAWAPLWHELETSGFASALLPEEQGGVGLGLSVGFVIAEQCGQAALSLPLVHTALIRSALSAAGNDIPEGALTLADQVTAEGKGILANVPFGLTADWALVANGGVSLLLPIEAATVVSRPSENSADATLSCQRGSMCRAYV